MATRKINPPPEENEPCFEEALAGLEGIVEAMEHEQLPLEDLVSCYERGSALLGRCESLLKAARERIELITLRNPAEIGLESDPGIPHAARPPSETADPDDDNDIRLF